MEAPHSHSRIRAALQEEESRQDKCVSCGRRLGGSESNLTPVVCTRCGRTCCFGKPCSRPASIGWNCIICHVKREMESSSGSWTDIKSDDDLPKANGKAPQDISSETFQVREFIEKLVEKLVGGSLDGVTVGKLSTHVAYNEMFSKYHEPLCQALARLGFALHLSISSEKDGMNVDTPSAAHTALSQLIDKIASDAEALPNLCQLSPSLGNSSTVGMNGKSYEDILSTAILNKVIDRFQRQKGYLDDLDDNRNFRRTSSSYLDEDNRSASDWSDGSTSEPLALKIEEHIEEVTTTYESSGEDPEEDVEPLVSTNRRVPFPEFGVDIVDGNEPHGSSEGDSDSCATDVISTQSTWEENWLFQKKKPKTARNPHHPVPVPMLVPNPSQEFRALIGGVDAEDISDLSECSDSALDEAMSVTADDPQRTQEIIDALNEEPPVSEELSKVEEGSEEPPSRSDDNTTSSTSNDIPSILCEDTLSSVETQETAPLSLEVETGSPSPCPSPSLVQQDRDIPVDYDQIAQINAPPVPKPRTMEATQVISDVVETEEVPPICSIAEREKAKWNNAIEMKENPYTPESIAKRAKNRNMLFTRANALSGSVDFPSELPSVEEREPMQRRYSRDYYIKASRSPTGDHNTSRSADSPVSLRSESSLEDGESIYRIEIWDETPVLLERRTSSRPTQQGVTAPKLDDTEQGLITPQKRTNNHETSPERLPKVDSINYDLPSVKELKKAFNDSPKLATKPPIAPRTTVTPQKFVKAEPKQEVEIDYSLTPVSEIITNLTKKPVPEVRNKQEEIFKEILEIRSLKSEAPHSHKVPNQIVESDLPQKSHENISDSFSEESEEPSKLEPIAKIKKQIKPVHSLTARSIPKDFREGLKRSSQNNKSSPNVSVNEICTSSDKSTIPPLNIDLRGKKKFWENIIAKGQV